VRNLSSCLDRTYSRAKITREIVYTVFPRVFGKNRRSQPTIRTDIDLFYFPLRHPLSPLPLYSISFGDFFGTMKVEAERGQLLANEIKAEFFECSALDGSHVDAAFTSLIQKAGSAVAASEVGGHQHAIMTIRPLLHVQTREGSTQYCRNSDSRKRVFSADPIVLHSHFVQTHTTHTHTHTHTHTCTGAHNIIVVTAAAAAAATQSCFHIHA